MQASLRDPSADDTFDDSKLHHDEKTKPVHAAWLKLHKDLIGLRRSDPTFNRVQQRGDVDGAVLGPDAFVVRYFNGGDDRLLLVNLGSDLTLDPCPEPLLAPPAGMRWSVLLCTEEPQYNGCGWPNPDTEEEGWLLHGRCAFILRPRPAEQATVPTRHLGRGSLVAAKDEESD
jgi:maltooligosyltrehalose trehalohydrolase